MPKERLLEVNVADGWEPLCKFLGRPVPPVPFPRENDAEERDKAVGAIVRQAIMAWLGIFAVIGVAGFGGWRVWNRS